MPAMQAEPQKANRTSELAEAPRALKLAKEIKDAYFLSLSPDGSRICVNFTKHPNTTFLFRSGERGRIDGGNPKIDGGNPKKESLSVIRLGSWDVVYSDQLSVAPGGRAEFFVGANVLYIESTRLVAMGQRMTVEHQRMTIDLMNGHQEQLLQTLNADDPPSIYCQAANSRVLIGTETGRPPARHSALIRAELPTFNEVQRVPFAVPAGAAPEGFETGIVISDDRETLIYALGHTLVCRRTDDLAVLWTQPIERNFWGIRNLAISANGKRVAVAVIDTTLWDYQRKFYVGIYNGKDGKELARLPVNGDQGVAVSTDGGSLAIGKRLQKGPDIQLLVEIFDIASGNLVARGTHDRVPPGHFQNLNGHFDRLRFTSDGKYLVTSGNNRVRIWETA